MRSASVISFFTTTFDRPDRFMGIYLFCLFNI
jgi:hypothetical protein